MQVFGLNGCFARLSKYSSGEVEELSEKARFKVQVLDLWRRTGNMGLVCEHYGVSRATVYRWRSRFKPRAPHSLEDQSRRPHRVRRPQWSDELEVAVRALRREYGWGKDKLAVILKRSGYQSSASTVGRIIRSLKHRKLIIEPERMSLKTRRRIARRPYAVRKPKGWVVDRPGDLVQVDTVDLNRHLGERRKQFTARDMLSRWDVIEAHTRATAGLAAGFLDTLQRDSPYRIKAIQVDGGSEFAAEFEQACKDRKIRLFVLPPRSPKLNGRVERAQRTHREEYYERFDISQSIEEHNKDLKGWQDIYNMVRPHQALGQRTPLQVLQEFGILPNVPPPPALSHML